MPAIKSVVTAHIPQKDIPFGILGSLVVCTILYMFVAAVLTGLVDYRLLSVPDPMAVAVDAIGLKWFSLLIKACLISKLTNSFTCAVANNSAWSRSFVKLGIKSGSRATYRLVGTFV
jgi:amino acid transporter